MVYNTTVGETTMDAFDDIQIEETSSFEYGEYYDNLILEEEEDERSFFQYLNSNIDY